MNVRLLRGPIQREPRIKPNHSSKWAMTAAAKRRSELAMNNGCLPTKSDNIPAIKLPTAYAPKV